VYSTVLPWPACAVLPCAVCHVIYSADLCISRNSTMLYCIVLYFGVPDYLIVGLDILACVFALFSSILFSSIL
jgi:hypothetical protein